jgi:hypothetical protein
MNRTAGLLIPILLTLVLGCGSVAESNAPIFTLKTDGELTELNNAEIRWGTYTENPCTVETMVVSAESSNKQVVIDFPRTLGEAECGALLLPNGEAGYRSLGFRGACRVTVTKLADKPGDWAEGSFRALLTSREVSGPSAPSRPITIEGTFKATLNAAPPCPR